MEYLIARLREPSTYAGLAVILGLIGVNTDQQTLGAIGAGVLALVSIIAKEGV